MSAQPEDVIATGVVSMKEWTRETLSEWVSLDAALHESIARARRHYVALEFAEDPIVLDDVAAMTSGRLDYEDAVDPHVFVEEVRAKLATQ